MSSLCDHRLEQTAESTEFPTFDRVLVVEQRRIQDVERNSTQYTNIKKE